MTSEPAFTTDLPAPSRVRDKAELVLVSVLILYLELACIRWFPAHVLFLTFFTNTVLLACFLGMSIGCLVARQRRDYLLFTAPLLAVALAAAHGVEAVRSQLVGRLDVGNQASPQLVFFGTEYQTHDVTRFPIPMEVLEAFFFVAIALVFVGPGQELGRAFTRVPNRVVAYTLNIVGSVAGIVLFAACSWLSLPPVCWLLLAGVALGYLLLRKAKDHRLAVRASLGALAVAVGLAALTSGPYFGHTHPGEHLWSPYYRIDYDYPPEQVIAVNLIGHQQMRSKNDPYFAYDLPYVLNRDASGPSLDNVLVIGAGSGNDVSRALKWGARHVDAVEIDPVILGLGTRDHPDHPYQDPRVSVHLDDGRNFLRSTDTKYDLVVYALVDSLVLHSSLSNIRLESYLFTQQALADVRAHLKPTGLFFMYNYFRQGWIVGRLDAGLTRVFGDEPLVLTLPYEETVPPEQNFSGFTIFVANATGPIRAAFDKHPEYWLRKGPPPDPTTPSGFLQSPSDMAEWERIGLAHVAPAPGELKMATDDWPFLYLRRPMIPALSLRGMALMGALSALLLFLFRSNQKKTDGPTKDNVEAGGRFAIDGRMFFLGAGFMLVETKAVVHMALCFGSTWMINSVVFFAVLVMILLANLYVLRAGPERLWPYYVGLLASLTLSCFVPLDYFLGMNRAAQVLGSCLLVFTPILFAGIIFAVAFSRCADPDRALGANIAGAILGGLAEYSSMLVGFQYLVVVAMGLYVLSAVRFGRATPSEAVLVNGQPALEAVPPGS